MKASYEISRQVTLERLKSLGFSPQTIFDIGYASGTSHLYGIFEDARYCIIEPLEESQPLIEAKAAEYPGSVAVCAAAGAEEGTLSFGVDPGLSGSSFFLKSKNIREVPVTTIDALVNEHSLIGPMLMKLDVQGFELEALKGGQEALQNTEIVIVEQSLWADRKSTDLPTPFEMFAFFEEHDFTLYDIAGLLYRPRDGALAELDLVFCKKNSGLRRHATYRTPEQAAERLQQKRELFKQRLDTQKDTQV
jgi:FkbM family methyltransferase